MPVSTSPRTNATETCSSAEPRDLMNPTGKQHRARLFYPRDPYRPKQSSLPLRLTPMPTLLLISLLTLLQRPVTFLLTSPFGARIVLPLNRRVQWKNELCRNLQPLCATMPTLLLLHTLMITSPRVIGVSVASRKEPWFCPELQLASLRLYCAAYLASLG